MIYALAACALLIAALIPAVASAVIPDKPGDFVALRGESKPEIARLRWTAPEGPVAYYRVVVATSPSGPYVTERYVKATEYTFSDGLGGMDYYFYVSAVAPDGAESSAAFAGPVAAEWAISPHAETEYGMANCLVCHSVHNAGTDTLMRQELSYGSSSQCVSCHDGRVVGAANVASGTVDSFGLASGHSLGPSETGAMPIGDCSTCHQVHATTKDGRMLPAKKVNGKAVTSAGTSLCVSCHDSDDSWTGGDYAPTSAPSRDATGYPVSGTWPGPDTYLSPSNPHRLIPESTQTVTASAPVRREQGDCRYCHTSHGSKNAYDGLKETYTVPTASTLASDQADGTSAALCYTCHGGTAPSGFTAAPGTDIKRFSTADAATSAGHTIVTAGGTLPVGAPLPCFECHNPHGSKRGNESQLSDERGGGLSTASAGGVRQFCFTCHTTSDTTTGWDSAAGAYSAPGADSKVVGLPRTGALLRLPTNTAHEQGDGRNCYDCHGNDYGVGGRNVHNPASGVAAPLTGALASDTGTWTIEPSLDATVTADESLTAGWAAAIGATESSPGTETTAVVQPPLAAPAEETSTTLFGAIGKAIVGFFSGLG